MFLIFERLVCREEARLILKRDRNKKHFLNRKAREHNRIKPKRAIFIKQQQQHVMIISNLDLKLNL